MNTIIYLVKHADELKENGIRNTKDTAQLINEKYILSVKGEEQSRKLSKNQELDNIDVLWSSSYARAKATAKYIAYRNNIKINIDSSLDERKLGNLEDLSIWMQDKTVGVVQAYLEDKKWKAREGESCEEATKRVTLFLQKILKENGLEPVIQDEREELDKENVIVKDQIPKAGIMINKENKVYIEK